MILKKKIEEKTKRKFPLQTHFLSNYNNNQAKQKRMQHTHKTIIATKKNSEHAKFYCNKMPKSNNDKKYILIILKK